jgi:hypothetical protein
MFLLILLGGVFAIIAVIVQFWGWPRDQLRPRIRYRVFL